MTKQELVQQQAPTEILQKTPGDYTTHSAFQSSDEYKAMLFASRWAKPFEQLQEWHNANKQTHNISQDTTPGEVDFTTLLVPAKTPELIGRELVTIIPVSVPQIQIPVFHVGKSGKSARGEQNFTSRTGRMTYIIAKLTEDVNTADTVDQTFIEDIQMGMIQYYWQELTRAHRQEVSQMFIDFVLPALSAGTHTDPSGNSYKTVAGQIATTTTAVAKENALDLITDAVTYARTQNWMPDCLVLTYEMLAVFLKSDDFKSHDFFRDMANYNTGMISSLFGMKVYVTNQKSGKHFWMFEKAQYACAIMRRDEMITNIDNNPTLTQGLSISSRFGFAYRDASRVYYYTAT